jgi:hypothetical protein
MLLAGIKTLDILMTLIDENSRINQGHDNEILNEKRDSYLNNLKYEDSKTYSNPYLRHN